MANFRQTSGNMSETMQGRSLSLRINLQYEVMSALFVGPIIEKLYSPGKLVATTWKREKNWFNFQESCQRFSVNYL